MPSDWIYVCGNPVGIALDRSVTRFAHLGGQLVDESTEANTQLLARAAYTWQNTGARVTQNNLDATTSVFARVGGADQTALDVQIGAGATGFFEDTTGTVSVSDGDLINYRVATGSGAHGDTITFTAISSQLQHASLERPMTISTALGAVAAQGATRFFIIVGGLGASVGTATEADVEYILRQGVTFSNLRCFVGSNSTDNSSTFDFREDGASSASLTISIGAGATGAFEDTDSEAVATGSTVNFRVVSGAGMSGDSIDFSLMQLLQAGSVSGRNLGCGIPATLSTRSPGTTEYLVLEQQTDLGATTELDVQIEASVAVDATDMFVRVILNSLSTATTTIALRVNGADSALDISISAGSTGAFEDSSTVSIGVDDLVNWEVAVAAGGTGAFRVHIIGLEQGQTLLGAEQPFSEPPLIHRELVVRAY